VYERPRKRALKNFEHSVAIGTFYAALRCALEYHGRRLADWQGDHVLAGRDPQLGGVRYDRVRVVGVREEVAVLPDGTFTLDGGRYFVELDRGSMNLDAWRAKVRAYEAYRRSQKLRDRYGVDAFTVLVVAPTAQRVRRIAEAVVGTTRKEGSQYRYLVAERVHPVTIRPRWEVVEAVTWVRRQVVTRLVELPGELRFGGRELWARPAGT
jgi:Replication-relaxation